MRMSPWKEKWSDRESCALSRKRAREMEAGEVFPISAGTGAPVPWTGGAVLANIQPSPCSTTSSTHVATAFEHPTAKPPPYGYILFYPVVLVILQSRLTELFLTISVIK